MKKPAYTLEGKNNIEIFEDHAEIIVTYKKTQEFRVLIDNEDIDKVKDFKWLYKTGEGSIWSSEAGTYLRRIIMNCSEEEYLLHKNDNKLDCRKSNLQITKQHVTSVSSSNWKENEYSIFEDHAEIIIANDENEWRILIDLEDVEKCKEYFWRINSAGIYGGHNVYLHRIVTDDPKGKDVVYKDNNNRLDNRKENLMVLTRSEKNKFYNDPEKFLAEREQQNNKSYGSAPVVETNSLQCTGVVKVINGFLVILDNGQQAIITEKDFNNAITKILGNLE
jgi:hypothetical protein